MNTNPPNGSPPAQDQSAVLPPAESAPRERKMPKREETEPIILNMLPMMALFTIILCYLLQNYSTDPVQITPSPGTVLPHSTTDLAPQEAVQVAISDAVIMVDDYKAATVKNGRVTVDAKKDRNPASMFIVPLYDALKKASDKQKMFEKYNKKMQFKGLLTIIADKHIPFRLLTEVLYTAGQAEFGAYKFAVMKKEE